MRVEVLVVPGCPNRALALRRVREAIERLGRRDVTVVEREITDAGSARRAGLRGSPTVLVDGHDPVEEPGLEPSLSCRLYAGPDGALGGAPTTEALTRALARP